MRGAAQVLLLWFKVRRLRLAVLWGAVLTLARSSDCQLPAGVAGNRLRVTSLSCSLVLHVFFLISEATSSIQPINLASCPDVFQIRNNFCVTTFGCGGGAVVRPQQAEKKTKVPPWSGGLDGPEKKTAAMAAHQTQSVAHFGFRIVLTPHSTPKDAPASNRIRLRPEGP